MKVCILGCGYVGSAAALLWRERGLTVSAVTRQTSRMAHLQTLADQVFCLDSQSLHSILAQQNALLISVAPDPSSDYASTYLKTAQLIAEQADKQPSLRQIIYTSSLSVYGDHQGNWIDEYTPPAPMNQNAKILLEAERILLSCASEHLKVCVFRLGEIYGPGREIENRLKRTISQPFAGTGSSYTNLIHLDDIVGALDFALEHHLQGIYNLCSDFHIPRRLFYQEICKREDLSSVQWDPGRASPHQGNRRASNLKIKKAGFEFSFPQYAYSS